MDNCLGQLEAYKARHPDYASQHKGSPFYVMGYCAFAQRDYSGAGLFFDAALTEDHRYHRKGAVTAAKRFMRLETTPGEVLASEIILEVSAALQELLDVYNARPDSKALSLDDLRNGFLAPIANSPRRSRRTLVTALISFAAEWKYRHELLELVEKGSPEVVYLHLLRGCVLFESLLKESRLHNSKSHKAAHAKATGPKATLRPVLEALWPALGLTPGAQVKLGADDLDVALKEVRGAKTVEECVLAAGKLRNTVGHKISWPSLKLTAARYDKAVEVVSTACLHAISRLYV